MNMMNMAQFSQDYLAEDIGSRLLATSITFLVLETVFITLMYASRYYAKGERANMSMEVFMTMTYLVCAGKITIFILMVKIGGTGRHLVALQPATMSTALKLSTASQIMCPLTTSLSKLGVLCFFQRILGKLGRWYRIAIWTTITIVTMVMVGQVLVPFVNCRPFSKTWEPERPGTCSIPSLALWRYLGIPNVFTTFIVVAIPAPRLLKLHVSRPMKLGLSVVFCICVVGVVAAIMRTRSFLNVQDFHDITYENVAPLCWTVSESGIYLIAGVLPTLKPLLKRIFKDTAIERFLTAKSHKSASFQHKRISGKKWYQRTREVDAKPRRSLSDTTVEGLTLETTKTSETSKSREQWV